MEKTIIADNDFYYIDSNDPVIGSLKNGQLYGANNYFLLRHFSRQEHGWIIDCGAHIGTFGFVPAIEDKQTLLIEAAQQNCECLRATFKPFNNVIIEQSIILDKKQKCDFSTTYGPFGSPQIKEDGSQYSSTIDEICLKNNIDTVSMIKIDIEGFEEEALSGATNIIESNKPVMMLEINGHCLRLINKKPFNILEKLEQLNYMTFIVNNDILIPIDKKEKFPFCVIDVLCIHKDNIHKYIGSTNFAKYIPDIDSIIKQNYSNSNDDCKKYFQSIM